MKLSERVLLLVAAGCSAFVAVLHVGIVVGGPTWYRWFGAPSLAAKVEAGAPLVPTAMAFAVTLIFAIWACYALSGAGAMRRLPLLRAGLFVIAGIYLLRGLQVVPEVFNVSRGLIPLRYAVFSSFSAIAGVLYLLGVLRLGRAAAGRVS
jgi:hypothetical protein